MREQLPFARGTTASQGNISIATSAGLVSQLPTATGLVGEATPYRPDLAGRVFKCTDTVLGTKVPMKLRCVQLQANVTVARKCITFSQTAGQFGSVSTSPAIPSAGTAGLIAKPLDPSYTIGATLYKYDWVYVVEDGPATLLAGTTTTAQGAVMCDANGAAAPCTAGEFPIGVAETAVTANGTNTVRVWVKDGLAAEATDAAGS